MKKYLLLKKNPYSDNFVIAHEADSFEEIITECEGLPRIEDILVKRVNFKISEVVENSEICEHDFAYFCAEDGHTAINKCKKCLKSFPENTGRTP